MLNQNSRFPALQKSVTGKKTKNARSQKRTDLLSSHSKNLNGPQRLANQSSYTAMTNVSAGGLSNVQNNSSLHFSPFFAYTQHEICKCNPSLYAQTKNSRRTQKCNESKR